jgi:opacity protein-like surface antigen
MTMIKQAGMAALVAAGILTASTAASAQDVSPWSVSFDAGMQASLSGDAHGGGRGTVLNLPTQVDAKTYGDVFGPGFYWKAGLGYAVGGAGELRVAAAYTSNPADSLQVGNVAGLPLLAQFEDYKSLEMDFGYRQYLTGRDAAVRPFVGGSVGFVNVDRIRGTFSVPAAGVVLPDVPFYESSTVPGFGVGGGVQVGLTDHLAVQGGIDLRWHGDLSPQDGLAGTGLESINDQSRRWAMPVTAGITVRF